MDLAEFAEQDAIKPGNRCRMCQEVAREHLEQINEQQGRVSYAAISRWLSSLGYAKLTDSNVRKHLVSDHPLP